MLQANLDRTEAAKSYLDLFRNGMSRRVLLGMALQMWSQLTGTNVMMLVNLQKSRGLRC
jgi:hypothetical protein